MLAKIADHFPQLDQPACGVRVNAGLRHDDGLLVVGGRIVELNGHEPLAGGMLQVLHHALVTGIVGDHQVEFRLGFQQQTAFFLGQDAPVVGERMNDHRGVLAGFHHFVQVADGPVADRQAQRAVLPHGFVALQQVAAHQIRGGKVFVAGDGDQGPGQLPGYMFQKPGFAASGGPFKHDRQFEPVGGFEQPDFIPEGQVIGLSDDVIAFDGDAVFAAAGVRRIHRCRHNFFL